MSSTKSHSPRLATLSTSSRASSRMWSISWVIRAPVKPRLISLRCRACSGSSIETIDSASAPPPFGRTPCAAAEQLGLALDVRDVVVLRHDPDPVHLVAVHRIVLAHPAEHVVRDAADVQRRVEGVRFVGRSRGGHDSSTGAGPEPGPSAGFSRYLSASGSPDLPGATRAKTCASSRARASSAARRPSDWGRCSTRTPITALRIARTTAGSWSPGASGHSAAQPARERVLERVRGLEQRLEDVVVAVDRLGDQRPPQVFVGGHADEEVVEQRREPVLDAAGQALGERRRREVGGPPVRDRGLEQVALRREVVVQRGDVQPAGRRPPPACSCRARRRAP